MRTRSCVGPPYRRRWRTLRAGSPTVVPPCVSRSERRAAKGPEGASVASVRTTGEPAIRSGVSAGPFGLNTKIVGPPGHHKAPCPRDACRMPSPSTIRPRAHPPGHPRAGHGRTTGQRPHHVGVDQAPEMSMPRSRGPAGPATDRPDDARGAARHRLGDPAAQSIGRSATTSPRLIRSIALGWPGGHRVHGGHDHRSARTGRVPSDAVGEPAASVEPACQSIAPGARQRRSRKGRRRTSGSSGRPWSWSRTAMSIPASWVTRTSPGAPSGAWWMRSATPATRRS